MSAGSKNDICIFINMTKEQRKEYNKRYWENHKEELREKSKKYKKEHRAELNEYARQYRQDNLDKIRQQENQAYHRRKDENPEIIKAQRKLQRERHPEIYLKAQEKFRQNNPEKIKEWNRQYRKSQNGRALNLYQKYNIRDKEKGFDISNNITKQWIVDNIFNSSCIYCGDSDWTHLGADRIDNSKPHTPDNCVCACFICNVDRSDNYSVEEFKKYRQLHPRILKDQKSWEIVEQNGNKVLKKRTNF